MKFTKHGFTLIELLVVIAIIAILAAILFPVFAQAREKARQSSCLSNVKQISTAIALYVDDNHETFPMINSGGTAGKSFLTGKLEPYTKTWKIWQCPSSPYTINEADWTYDQFMAVCHSNGGYTCNVHVLGSNNANVYPLYVAPMKLARLKSPSNISLVTDGYLTAMCTDWVKGTGGTMGGVGNVYFPGGGLAGFTWTAGEGDRKSDFQNGRHNEGVNVAFADGHAEYMKCADFIRAALQGSKNIMLPTTW